MGKCLPLRPAYRRIFASRTMVPCSVARCSLTGIDSAAVPALSSGPPAAGSADLTITPRTPAGVDWTGE